MTRSTNSSSSNKEDHFGDLVGFLWDITEKPINRVYPRLLRSTNGIYVFDERELRSATLADLMRSVECAQERGGPPATVLQITGEHQMRFVMKVARNAWNRQKKTVQKTTNFGDLRSTDGKQGESFEHLILDPAAETEKTALVNIYLASFPPLERSVLQLHDDGYTFREVETLTGMSTGKQSRLLKRAREAIG